MGQSFISSDQNMQKAPNAEGSSELLCKESWGLNWIWSLVHYFIPTYKGIKDIYSYN